MNSNDVKRGMVLVFTDDPETTHDRLSLSKPLLFPILVIDVKDYDNIKTIFFINPRGDYQQMSAYFANHLSVLASL